MSLSIRVQFLAGYSGREWPPSPARLFKALVCAARSGWAADARSAIDDALRELEGKAPIIAAPEAILRVPRQRRFVPNNSIKWPPQRSLNPKKGFDLEPEPLWHWDINGPPAVWYHWPDVPSTVVNTVRELSRRVWSVGKGEDFAVLHAVEEEPPPSRLTSLQVTSSPQSVGHWLEVPEAGCLDVCDTVFWRSADDPPLPVASTRSVRYASDGDAGVSVPVSMLALLSRGRRRSWDARLLCQIVGPIRNLLDEVRGEIVDVLASDPIERERLAALAQRVLLGHDEGGDPVREPHLAVLPIPSILGPYPDGRIRRVALVGFGCGDDATRRAIVDMACILLYGRELLDNGCGTGVTLVVEWDRQWIRAITRRSRAWVTVTPVIQDTKELTSAEWRRLREIRRSAGENCEDLVRLEQRLQNRRSELLVRSLMHAVSADGARPISVEVAPGGPLAGVHIARHYRAKGYLAETSRLHLRVTFDRPVAGPVAVGRGRHVGYGLLWPDDDVK